MSELFYMVWKLDMYGDKAEGFAPMPKEKAQELLTEMRGSGMEDEDEQYIIARVTDQDAKNYFMTPEQEEAADQATRRFSMDWTPSS